MKRIITILLLIANTNYAQDKLVRDETPLPPTNKVVSMRPERFRYDISREPEDKFRAAMRFRSFDATGAEVLNFKLFPTKDPEARLTNQKSAEDVVREMTISRVPKSVEKTNVIQRLECDSGVGAYCLLTDPDLVGVAKLPPDQFKYLIAGLVRVDDCIFWVQGFSNDKDGTDFKAMLKILAKLKIEPEAPRSKPN